MKRTAVFTLALLVCLTALYSCSNTLKKMGIETRKFDPDKAATRNMAVLKPALALSGQQEKDLYRLHRKYYKRLLSDMKHYEDGAIDGHELELRARVLGFKTVRKAQQLLTPPQFEKYRQWARQEGIIK